MPPKRKNENNDDQKETDQKKTKESEVKPKLKDFVPKIKNNYPELYKKVKNYEDKKELFNNIIDEENGYRELFAQTRDSPIISDNHLMLIDVFKNKDIFKYVKWSKEEEELPKIFPIKKENLKEPSTDCIVDQKDFERNFGIFCEDQLRYLNWDNVLAAGGSIVAALTPIPGDHGATNKSRRKYYHDIAYAGSDVDLFIYGLETEEECNKKLVEIYEAVTESNPRTCIAFRSKHVVTLISEYPYRHIQIVLRQYKTAAEVLMCFDVDGCSVGYDGKSVYMTPRAHRALTHQYNVVDMERRSPSYEMRLAKYAERGFAVVVPSLDRDKIDPQLFERRFDQLQGLARLLLLEKLKSPESRYRYKEQLRLKKLRPEPKEGRTSFVNKFGLDADDLDDEREAGSSSASDYSTVYLPWGRNWSAEKIRKLCYTKDVILNSEWYSKNKKYHTHPCFFGTAQDIIKDCCGCCPPVKEEDIDPDAPYVSGKLTWVTVNPGAQGKVGSFNPITEGDWTHGTYILSSAEKFAQAVNKNDVETVKYCIEKEGTDIESRDAVGRTGLHIAALSGSVEVAKYLLEHGARVSGKTIDGKTALHLASAYGHHKIVKLLLKRGKQIEEDMKNFEENQKKESGKVKKETEKEKEKTKDKKESEKEKKSSSKKTETKKKPKKKSKKEDSEDEGSNESDDEKKDMSDEDDDERDEDGEGDDEDEDGGDGDDDFEGIASIIERKKKEALEILEKFDPLAQDNKPDVLEIGLHDWDMDMSPLHFAIFYGWPKVITALVKGGASLEEVYQVGESSVSLLQLAILGGSIPTVKALLKLKVDPNQTNTQMETGLHHAAKNANFEIIKLIVENGKTDLNIISSEGLTPLALLLSHNLNEYSNKKSKKEDSEDSYEDYGKRDQDEDDDDEDEEYPTLKETLSDDLMKIIEFLVKNGAKVHLTEKDIPEKKVRDEMPSRRNRWGYRGDEEETDRMWLRSNVEQPICIAIQYKSKKLVEFFLKKGAEVNWINESNNTPLDIIVSDIENYERQVNYQDHNNKNITKIITQMKKYKEDSLEWFYLNEHKEQFLGKKSIKKWQEQNKKRKLATKTSIKYLLSLKELLTKNKAKKFQSMTLTGKDAYLKPRQKEKHNYNKNYDDKEDEEIKFTYSSIEDVSEYNYRWNSKRYSEEENANYHKLFKAIWNGDIKEVEKLTIKQPIGKQVHVASKSELTGWSTLYIAIFRKNPEMVKRLIEIVAKQHTPLIEEEEKEDDTPAINNYELVSLMKNVGAKSLRRRAQKTKIKNAKKDPNSNCLTSLYSYLAYKDYNTQFNMLHCCAYSNSNDSLKVILEYLKDDKMKYKNEDGKEETLKDLLVDRGYKQFTPFELAIARGNVESARNLLKAGGIDLPDLSEKDEYKGLDVGGKKMEWAFEHMERKVRYDRTAYHLSAAYGRLECIDFLKEEAIKLWNKLKVSALVKDFNYFDPFTNDSSGKSPLHWAIYNNNSKVIPVLLKLDDGKMLNSCDELGISPLHIAASSDTFFESLKILLEAGADMDIKDKHSGYTALHIACSVRSKNAENLKLLIEKSNKKQINAFTEKLHQTPLMIAAHYGNLKAIQLLVESKKCDLGLRDICGDYALQFAIKKSNHKCVKYLVEEIKKVGELNDTLITEDGMGLSALDFSMLRMGNKLADARGYYSNIDLKSDLPQVYHFISSTSGGKRIMTTNDYTRETTNIILDGVENFEFSDFFSAPRTYCPTFDKFADEQKPIEDEKMEDSDDDKKDESSSESSSSSSSEEDESPDDFDDMVVCISGTFSVKRTKIEEIIKKNGGKVSSSVTKATTHVLTDDADSDTSKVKKGREMGLKIVTEKFISKFLKKK